MTTSIGEFIREKRGKRSKREIARLAGISDVYLGKIELGKDVRTGGTLLPSPEVLEKLAPVLGVNYIELAIKAGYLSQDEINQLVTIQGSLNKQLDNLKQGANEALESVSKHEILPLDKWLLAGGTTWRGRALTAGNARDLMAYLDNCLDNELEDIIKHLRIRYNGRKLDEQDRERILDKIKELFPEDASKET